MAKTNRESAGQRRQEKPVSVSRRMALAVLCDVEAGSYAEDALTRRFDTEKIVAPGDRALTTQLVYGVLRWQSRLDAIVDRCSNHPSSKISPVVRHILRLGVYQLLMLDRIPDHSAVDESVGLAHGRFGAKTAGFVNALLRRTARERATIDPLPNDDIDSLAVYYSHPDWLVKRWLAELGPSAARAVLAHNNLAVPLVLRANPLKTSREALAEVLREKGFSVEFPGVIPAGLRIEGGRASVSSLPGFAEGLFAVQETASQMIAPLLGISPGDRVLDVCAAPGGKTAHLAALAGNNATILAVDAHASRLAATEKNLERLGVTCVEAVLGDSRNRGFLRSLGRFDRILVDPPCSGLGVLRHNPETKTRVKREDPARYAAKELEILLAAAQVLNPGGTLLYCVCTPMKEETFAVVGRFLRDAPEFKLDAIRPEEVGQPGLVKQDGVFSSFPPTEEEPMDGFFAARLVRVLHR
jgi:16S rRNA (cytosine967-C5)-methyltransferase